MRLLILVTIFCCAAFAGYAQEMPVRTSDPAIVKPKVATEAKSPIRTVDYTIKPTTSDSIQKMPVKSFDNSIKQLPAAAEKMPLPDNKLANPAVVQENRNSKASVNAKSSQATEQTVPASDAMKPLQPKKQQ